MSQSEVTKELAAGVWVCPHCKSWVAVEGVLVNGEPAAKIVGGNLPIELCQWMAGAWNCCNCSGSRMERKEDSIVGFIEKVGQKAGLKPEDDLLFARGRKCKSGSHVEFVKETIYGLNPGGSPIFEAIEEMYPMLKMEHGDEDDEEEIN